MIIWGKQEFVFFGEAIHGQQKDQKILNRIYSSCKAAENSLFNFRKRKEGRITKFKLDKWRDLRNMLPMHYTFL